MKKPGKVYIVGAGPGDPGLVTLKAVRCLGEADVVVYDYLVAEGILSFAKKAARMIYVGKKGGCHTMRQEEINQILVREAKEGNNVVRLKGGDPFIFGRGGEEAEELAKAGLYYEVVPGVTSAVSAPAYAGIPLTHRSFASTVAFVTGHEDPAKGKSGVDWKNISGIGTLVFLMAMKNLPNIVDKLKANGKDAATPVALIRWGTTPDQETLVSTLGEIVEDARKTRFRPPSMLVVGGVVNLRRRINWFETRPLFGKGVVITRPREQAGEFAALLHDQGARVIHFPTIEIVPASDSRGLDLAIGEIESYRWIIFTSANGVKYFFARLSDLGRDIRDLKGIRICSIGPATASAVEEKGIHVDMVPSSFISEGVVEAFKREDIKGERMLLPRAEKARDVIPVELGKLGASVDVVAAYRTMTAKSDRSELEGLMKEKKVDVITFTSASTVTNFMKIMGRDNPMPPHVKIASIGPVTAAAVEKAGLKTDIMQEQYTVPGLVEGMIKYFSRAKRA